MKELTKMPVKVSNGDEIEVFEYAEGFAMTSEFLGKCLGFKHPIDGMANLFRRNREALEPHRFTITATGNSLGGRPPKFYNSEGIILAASRAGTPEAKNFLPLFLTRLRELESRRIERIEAYWFGKRPWWPECRERIMRGETFKQIAEAMGRSAASVRNAVSRMIEVGILQPLRAAQALTGRAKRTVIGYGRKFYKPKDDRQQGLFDALPA